MRKYLNQLFWNASFQTINMISMSWDPYEILLYRDLTDLTVLLCFLFVVPLHSHLGDALVSLHTESWNFLSSPARRKFERNPKSPSLPVLSCLKDLHRVFSLFSSLCGNPRIPGALLYPSRSNSVLLYIHVFPSISPSDFLIMSSYFLSCYLSFTGDPQSICG